MRLCLTLVCSLAVAHAAHVLAPFSEGHTRSPAVPDRTELKGTDGPIFGLAWSPDGRMLASAGVKQIHIWRIGALAPLRTFRQHSDLVRSVAWSPNGQLIASVGDDNVARVWNAESLQQVLELATGPDRAIGWSPDGSRLATSGASGMLKIWNGASGALLHSARLQTTISGLAWSPNGARIAVAGVNGMTTVWDANTGKQLSQMYVSWPERNDVNGITWSRPGGLLAMAHGARGVGGVTLWNPAAKTVAHSLTDAGGWLRGISWSPDGQWLAIGGEDGNVRIQEVETAKVAVTLVTDSKPVWSVAWSPDGRRLAAGNTGSEGPPRLGGTITVWETPVRVLAGERAIARARSIETLLVDRRIAAPAASKPAPVATAITANGAAGVVMRLEPPFGNLETSFTEADFRSVQIAVGSSFVVRCREKTFTVLFGQHWGDVARGEWVAYPSVDGTVIVSRNLANAAEASECRAGDSVFVTSRPR